jgi:hypothetical protein
MMGRKTRGSANAETVTPEIVGMGADNKSGAEFQSLKV